MHIGSTITGQLDFTTVTTGLDSGLGYRTQNALQCLFQCRTEANHAYSLFYFTQVSP